MNIKLLLIFIAAINVNALYSSNTKVVQLTKETFDSLVKNSKDLWIVEFYAPWCGHCKSLAPEFEKAAAALEGMVRVGAVDMTQEQSVGAPYNIQGYPTLKVFGSNKNSPTDYNGERTAKAIVDQMVSEVRKVATERLGGKSNGSSGSTGSQGSKGSGQCGGGSKCGGNHGSHGSHGSQGSQGSGHEEGADTVVLTGDNFKELVTDQDSVGWLIIFYAPWCGHCKAALPEWNEAATAMKKEKRIKFGMINCDEHKSECGNYGIRGYPTIKWRKKEQPCQCQKAKKISFLHQNHFKK